MRRKTLRNYHKYLYKLNFHSSLVGTMISIKKKKKRCVPNMTAILYKPTKPGDDKKEERKHT